jgi:hypothetical protein
MDWQFQKPFPELGGPIRGRLRVIRVTVPQPLVTGDVCFTPEATELLRRREITQRANRGRAVARVRGQLWADIARSFASEQAANLGV